MVEVWAKTCIPNSYGCKLEFRQIICHKMVYLARQPGAPQIFEGLADQVIKWSTYICISIISLVDINTKIILIIQCNTLSIINFRVLEQLHFRRYYQWRTFVCWRPTAIYCVLLMRPFAEDVPMPKISHFNHLILNSLKNIQFQKPFA